MVSQMVREREPMYGGSSTRRYSQSNSTPTTHYTSVRPRPRIQSSTIGRHSAPERPDRFYSEELVEVRRSSSPPHDRFYTQDLRRPSSPSQVRIIPHPSPSRLATRY